MESNVLHSHKSCIDLVQESYCVAVLLLKVLEPQKFSSFQHSQHHGLTEKMQKGQK